MAGPLTKLENGFQTTNKQNFVSSRGWKRSLRSSLCLLGLVLLTSAPLQAQSVCLPAPRLLTTMPMGGQVGNQIEVTITGENLDDSGELVFSHPAISSAPVFDAQGRPVPNKYVVTISGDCPVGLHEARMMTRLGISSSRAFSVDMLPEVTRTASNSTVATAMSLALNTICNASMSNQAIDHYKFEVQQGQRIVIDCAARGIDSKLTPVVVLADAHGADLQVERRGGVIDFTAPQGGTYMAKVHDLTYKGGTPFFYRLVLRELAADEPIVRFPATREVSAFSWPPTGLPEQAATKEVEPNNQAGKAQKITLPCDISGSFYPAADVDTYEFTAQKGEIWWVEVASERLGRKTDPSLIVQHVAIEGDQEKLTDVVELTDIASPLKVSSNGYSYDGPPYNIGSTDILGQFEIKQDGVHRLQVLDLFGGTRNDPQNEYRLVIRQAQPDFAVAGWSLHMNLRNGDRNALSKPLSLRGGASISIEVLALRRDGFNGEINLRMDNLPEGVTAHDIKIPAGQSRGLMLLTAAEGAPRSLASIDFYGVATINDQEVKRPCYMASMAWPVTDAWGEIPAPRLMMDVPLSVSGEELAPITIAAAEDKVWEAKAGEKLTIPIKVTRRCEFSGTNINLRPLSVGIGSIPAFDVPVTADTAEVVLDLATLKTAPGEYHLAFCGPGVAKYSYNPAAVTESEGLLALSKQELEALETEAKGVAEQEKAATDADKPELQKRAQEVAEKVKQAQAAVKEAEARVKRATDAAKPRDIVDIVVTTPMTIRVNAVENK